MNHGLLSAILTLNMVIFIATLKFPEGTGFIGRKPTILWELKYMIYDV